MAEDRRPQVGVGVIIHDKAGNIVMGERAGSHGAGKSPHIQCVLFVQHKLLLMLCFVVALC